MNWSVLLFTAIISGIALWLGARYLGKRGLMMVAVLEAAIALTVAYNASAVLFGVLIPAILIPLFTVIFVIFLFYKKYAFKDVVKLLIITGSALLLVGLTNTLYDIYLLSFGIAWEFAIVPMLIVMASLFGAAVVGYFVDVYSNFIKDTNYRNAFALLCSIIVGCFIFVVFNLVGQVSFGAILLSIVISILVSILFVAALLVLNKMGLFADKNEVKNPASKKNHLSDKIIFDQIKQDKVKTAKNAGKSKNEIEIEDYLEDEYK